MIADAPTRQGISPCGPFLARRIDGLDLTNRAYLIRIGNKNWTERYARDKQGWYKVSARGRRFRMTAEQVLNHLLPALAGIKPGLRVEVKHRPRKRPAKPATRPPNR